MAKKFRALAAAGGVMMAMTISATVWAQKQGGILRQYMIDSPASMSIHEEATPVATRPVMAVFNNLVMFDERVPQNSLASIIPDLATGWSWNEDGTELTFPLRQGVAWHDGKPFTAKDVKCTWDLVAGKAGEKLRINPRKPWYRNLEEVVANGDFEVTFRLKRPQPAFLHVALGSRIARVHQQGDHVCPGTQLRKQLEPLGRQIEAAEAREVAAGPGETGNETQPDRVSADGGEDDRDRRGRAFRRQWRNVAAGCHNQIALAADEVGSQCGQPIIALTTCSAASFTGPDF